MEFKKGKDRTATISFDSLDSLVAPDSQLRLIDAFVEHLDLKSLGFDVELAATGSSPYHPSVLLKIFIYGYLNSERSSRKLEKWTKTNLELMWLVSSLSPDHNTISNFRMDNGDSIKKVFIAAVKLAIRFDLVGKKLEAGDGVFLRGQNSKKNNFNEKKIDRQEKYIAKKISGYLNEMEAVEALEEEKKNELVAKIEVLEERKECYKILRNELEKSGESQISLSDPDTRLLVKGGESMVGYNPQVVTDSLNNIPVDFEVTNEVDSGAMVGMLERTIENLELEKDEDGKLVEELKGTFDAGYYNGAQLEEAQRLGVTTYVAERESSSASRVPDEAFGLQNFKYDEAKDVYVCPANQELATNGNWSKVNDNGNLAKTYSTSACKDCPLRAQCTKSKAGRIVKRSQYAESYKQNKENLKADPSIYKQRQAIVEHPFGTIKRSWGFTYIITKKGKDRATADVGLMFLAYNLLRIFNILDFETLQAYLLSAKKVFFGCFSDRGTIKSLRMNFAFLFLKKHVQKIKIQAA